MLRVATVSTVCETLRISAYRTHPMSDKMMLRVVLTPRKVGSDSEPSRGRLQPSR